MPVLSVVADMAHEAFITPCLVSFLCSSVLFGCMHATSKEAWLMASYGLLRH